MQKVDERIGQKVLIFLCPMALPLDRPDLEIRKAVQKRARWIATQLESTTRGFRDVVAREYKSGETQFYLGRRYQLKVIRPKSNAEQSAVAMKGSLICVPISEDSPTRIRSRLKSWYRARAKEYLTRRLAMLSATIPWIDKVPPLKLTEMRKQWGSCSPLGSINLNPDLIRAPRVCIDYVIVHELCHLREHNHSKRYYALLDRHFPDWRPVKKRLDSMAELLLAS